MRIKRFEAQDTQTALAMVKEEMGDDAVILATRALAAKGGGRLRAGSRGPVEVVAAVDYDPDALTSAFSSLPTPADKDVPVGYDFRRRPDKTAGPVPPSRLNPAGKKTTSAIAVGVPARGAEPQAAGGEARDLRVRFHTLLKRQGAPVPPRKSTRSSAPQPPPALQTKAKPNPEDVELWRSQLINRLQVRPLAIDGGKGPTVIALIGATGVGKTTTAAKLAAWFSIHQGRKVTLLSMDCYRIGATDQLRTYARIMRLPCEIALSRKDLRQAVRKHGDRDLIIIDTAGKSPYDPHHIGELGGWFDMVPVLKPYLVVNATAKKEDLARVIKSYAPLEPEGLVVTKLDETRAYAALCQQIVASSLPVSCLCTGQRVPEDFLLASKEFLGKLFGQGWSAVAGELGAAADVYS